ncbi:hypothetical protein [Pseudomarimonas arenosa]|uniref:Lipoprotein n=1 Tax=Pseudomarimonas arenosa TaxID=2774145 RepID=A0AAW3ZP27_9GAMM|nr:hypothetical protein [Pseudomarimonas arenosa]MBD8526847.1 hypothetical protein [Pseudomarimonas arenosa]
MRCAKTFGFILLFSVLLGCASDGGNARKLDQTLYTYQSTLRWSDFAGALSFVDPEQREALALSDLEARRWAQYQVAGYYVQGSEITDDEVKQVVELRLINKHTQVERSVIDRQIWRWDSKAKAWWLTTPLPELAR